MAHVGNDREQRACVRESKQWAANNKYSQAEAVRVELVKDGQNNKCLRCSFSENR